MNYTGKFSGRWYFRNSDGTDGRRRSCNFDFIPCRLIDDILHVITTHVMKRTARKSAYVPSEEPVWPLVADLGSRVLSAGQRLSPTKPCGGSPIAISSNWTIQAAGCGTVPSLSLPQSPSQDNPQLISETPCPMWRWAGAPVVTGSGFGFCCAGPQTHNGTFHRPAWPAFIFLCQEKPPPTNLHTF